MNCEMAEDTLSAYLDDMLDAQSSHEVETHLEACENCREVLADYRRFDHLLAVAPRVEPAEELRTRIFQSAELAAILGKQDKQERASARRLASARQPEAPATDERRDAGVPARTRASGRGSPPKWSRVALQSAAVIALVLGSALLIKQGLLHFSPSGSQATQSSTPSTFGNLGQTGVPLAAGQRVVYLHDGALWSAPENGPGLAQRLTSAGVHVGGWAVSADGKMIAYIDAQTGRIHTVRSDGQSDQAISAVGHVSASFWNTSAGHAVAGGLAWSPDGEQIAYVAVDGSNQTILCVMNFDGTNDRTISNGGAAPVWSGDSLWIAYTEGDATQQSVWVYDLVSQQTRQLSAQADPSNANATIKQLAWLPDTLRPAVTWSAGTDNALTGIFTTALLGGSNGVQRLTPAGATLSAADYTARVSGGAWVAADASNGQIEALSARSGAALATTTGGSARTVTWSSTGTVAIVTTDGALSLWSPANSALTHLATGVVGAPVWSADGQWLAAATSAGVVSVNTQGATPIATYHYTAISGAATLLWAPDGQSLFVATSTDVRIVSRDGAQAKVVDTHVAQGTQVAWSVAG